MIRLEKLTPMLRMTDAEISAMICVGLYGRDGAERRKRLELSRRRDECQYDRYADDWECEGDD